MGAKNGHVGKNGSRVKKKFTEFTYFLPKMVPHPCKKLKHGTHLPFFCPHVYRIHLFPPIFHLKWYPILVKNSSMVPICRFSAHMFADSAHFPPMFHLSHILHHSASSIIPHISSFRIFLSTEMHCAYCALGAICMQTGNAFHQIAFY